LKRWILRGAIYALGLTLFLQMKWIDPSGNIISNVIAGFVLYAISTLVPMIFIRK
jgi:hypothetical protein